MYSKAEVVFHDYMSICGSRKYYKKTIVTVIRMYMIKVYCATIDTK